MAFMTKLLVVLNTKKFYTPFRPTRGVIIKKGEFYLEYLVGFVQVIILTHKTVF